MTSVLEFRVAVGEVSHHAAHLESVVALVTWGLAGLDQTVARIVVPNNMDRMLSLIGDLLPLRVLDDDALIADVKRWTQEVRAAYRNRSAILHSLWIPDDDQQLFWRVDIKPLGKPKEERTSADVSAVANELEYLATAGASVFMERLGRHFPPHVPLMKRP